MAHRIDDRWLWLGTGVLLIIAFRSIRHAIHETVLLTEVEPSDIKEQDQDQQKQPEDSKKCQCTKANKIEIQCLTSLQPQP